jgi:hypothetical protein
VENKDDISEDLLVDFRKEAPKKVSKKEEKTTKKVIEVNKGKKKISEEDFMFGAANKKKVVDIND